MIGIKYTNQRKKCQQKYLKRLYKIELNKKLLHNKIAINETNG